MKPATLSHNHMCTLWVGSAESTNSRAWTCSHKYTTHCPACIETNLAFLLSHRCTLVVLLFCFPSSYFDMHKIYMVYSSALSWSAWFQRSNTKLFPCPRLSHYIWIVCNLDQKSYINTSTNLSPAYQTHTHIHTILYTNTQTPTIPPPPPPSATIKGSEQHHHHLMRLLWGQPST